MFNRETILKSLNAENYYVDKHSLDLFLEDWKIDSIYEDENGFEFYDDLALNKIKKGISLKAQGYSDEQIIAKLSRIEAHIDNKVDDSVNNQVFQPQEQEQEKSQEGIRPLIIGADGEEKGTEGVSTELAVQNIQPIADTSQQGKSFTLDVSSQTLQMLAEAVAKKISDDITNSDIASRLIEAGGYKRDNEILAKQVQDLLEHNKELSQRIEHLESSASKHFWSKFWGKK